MCIKRTEFRPCDLGPWRAGRLEIYCAGRRDGHSNTAAAEGFTGFTGLGELFRIWSSNLKIEMGNRNAWFTNGG
jgi:hypothetical protein